MLNRTAIITIVVISAAARADHYSQSEDGLVVERSDLIVIAHIKADSFKAGFYTRNDREARATLVIEQVLKGDTTAREIEIRLTGIMEFSVGGENPFTNKPHAYYVGAPVTMLPAPGVINLHLGAERPATLLEAGKVWLLQRQSHTESGAEFVVTEFEELQDVELSDYYHCYVSADPEASVRAYVATHPALLARAKPYLDHSTVQHIRKNPHANERARRLAPYAMVLQHWKEPPWQEPEARTALAACGDVGCALLTPLYNDAALEGYRGEIVQTWSDARYEPAADLLIELLKKFNDMHRTRWAHREMFTRVSDDARVALEAMRRIRISTPQAKQIFREAEHLMSLHNDI